jgi:hypothetical protein
LPLLPIIPAGIYAYYLTIDSLGVPEYPYLAGPTYYGVVTAGNSGPGGGHVVISEPVNQYFPTSNRRKLNSGEFYFVSELSESV